MSMVMINGKSQYMSEEHGFIYEELVTDYKRMAALEDVEWTPELDEQCFRIARRILFQVDDYRGELIQKQIDDFVPWDDH